MYKMIIVDDEPLIRSGLMNFIEWEVYGIEIVGEAEDGMKAYQIVKSLHPDIALIDISMPNVNGIELIELCSHLDYTPKFIVLSGYNDFDYVRNAMQLGAVNYLLKPVDKEELTNTIITTIRQLDDSSEQKQHFQISLQALRNDVLVRILNNRIESRELREKCRFVNLSFHCSSMRIAVLKPVFNQEDNAPVWIDSSFLVICEQCCQESCSCYAVLDTYDNIALILKDYSKSMTDEQYQKLIKSCAKKLTEQLGISFLIALGNNASSVAELPDSYLLCKEILEREQVFGNMFQEGTVSKLEDNSVSLVDYSELSRCFESQDTDSLQKFIHTCFTHMFSDNSLSNLDTVKFHLIEFVIYAMQSLGSSHLPEQDIAQQKSLAFEIIRSTNSLPVLEEKLQTFFSSLMAQIKGILNTHYTFLVQNTLSYVRSNYNDCNLSLKTLASQLEVNAAYLGRQFALETGEYFSDYVNRIRVAQAIKLLDETTLKTPKIAEAVGFYNISYFFTIFKKITGRRPGDLRKNQ